MKDRIVTILIILTVIITTMIYNDRIHEGLDSIDKLEAGLGEIKNLTDDGANISYLYINDTTNFLYSYLWNRYVLAPRHLSPNASDFDTLLTVCSVSRLNKETLDRIGRKKILWKRQFESYVFFLSCGTVNEARQ